jgi:ferric-dicitrate binding protein FerR (iron transport regulator)
MFLLERLYKKRKKYTLCMDKELLYRFFRGDTSLREEKQIRKWMEASPEHRRVFFEERNFFDAVTLHVDENDGGKQDVRRLRRTNPLKELAKIAAVVALTLGGSFVYHYQRQAKESTAVQTVYVPAGQRVNITLPDGSNVWLNARTQLRYPVSFNGRERRMELDGEAYFNVVKDDRKPFVVKTALGTVEVTGTEFNVDAYASRNVFETALMKGEVKVRLNDRPVGEEVRLTPDRKAVWAEGRLHVEPVDDYTSYRWREGLICFKNESFISIMDDFEKYYGVTVRVKNQKVRQSFYTGKFRHTDGIDYALRVLQKDISFTYSRDDENQVIYIE